MWLLFDDDCGVCTSFAKFVHRLIGLPIMPMTNPMILKEGIANLGEEMYWKSFHIVDSVGWTSEKEAIIRLAYYFPMGSLLTKIASINPISLVLMGVLRRMQKQRKLECIIPG